MNQKDLDALAGEVAGAKFRTDDVVFWRWHDMQFHSRLARAAGNGILSRALENLLTDVYLSWATQPELGDLSRAQREHEQLIEALVWRDAELAAARMTEHLQNTAVGHDERVAEVSGAPR
jgi:DNA-binding GntR family transcriptional regulator